MKSQCNIACTKLILNFADINFVICFLSSSSVKSLPILCHVISNLYIKFVCGVGVWAQSALQIAETAVFILVCVLYFFICKAKVYDWLDRKQQYRKLLVCHLRCVTGKNTIPDLLKANIYFNDK